MRRGALPGAVLLAAVCWWSWPLLPGRAAELSAQQRPSYSIDAVRYGTFEDYPLSRLVLNGASDSTVDIAMMFWVVRGGDRTILFDVGFHRDRYLGLFEVGDLVPPDSALELVGIDPDDVTDIVVSHAHFDHMGGIDLFPDATIWIQADEFAYYTGRAWQEGLPPQGLNPANGGFDPNDILELVRRNTQGDVELIEGDDVGILPGIRVFTGGRHTHASQYMLVQGEPSYVLASDNAYIYRNIERLEPVATLFKPGDAAANVRAIRRMLLLAGSADRVIPGHDAQVFARFPGEGRIAHIKLADGQER